MGYMSQTHLAPAYFEAVMFAARMALTFNTMMRQKGLR